MPKTGQTLPVWVKAIFWLCEIYDRAKGCVPTTGCQHSCRAYTTSFCIAGHSVIVVTITGKNNLWDWAFWKTRDVCVYLPVGLNGAWNSGEGQWSSEYCVVLQVTFMTFKWDSMLWHFVEDYSTVFRQKRAWFVITANVLSFRRPLISSGRCHFSHLFLTQPALPCTQHSLLLREQG